MKDNYYSSLTTHWWNMDVKNKTAPDGMHKAVFLFMLLLFPVFYGWTCQNPVQYYITLSLIFIVCLLGFFSMWISMLLNVIVVLVNTHWLA